MQITEQQRKQLNRLWFLYGNNGKKHSHGNHRFIQNILEHGEDTRELYKQSRSGLYGTVTEECINEVDKILNDETETK